MKTKWVLGLAVLALASGCGKKNKTAGDDAPKAGEPTSETTITSGRPKPAGGSCFVKETGICEEYNKKALGLGKSACKSFLKGTYSEDACPAEDLMATCTKDNGDKKLYYFGSSVAPMPEDAEYDCVKKPFGKPGKLAIEDGAKDKALATAMPDADRIFGSCKRKTMCEDYYGKPADLDEKLCNQTGGTFEKNPCTSDSLAGSCLGHGRVKRFYKSKYDTPSKLKKRCETSKYMTYHFFAADDEKGGSNGKSAAADKN